MKTVLLLRHGKSDWHANFDRDHERPLAPRGRKAARAMGAWLSDKGPHPDAILCSTAVRARQTCAEMLRGASFAAPVEFERGLYAAHLGKIQEVIHAARKDCATIMLIGHEPTWSSAVEWFAGRAVDHFPTAAIARISFDCANWQRVVRSTGTLVWLQKPRELPGK